MNKVVARMIGEAVDTPPPAQVPPESAPHVDGQTDAMNPTVEQLVQLWQSGSKDAVALRVLDALDAYEDFVLLLFKIGEAGARELGARMDAFTPQERSPHQYDKVADTELADRSSAGGTPRPAPGSTRGAVGE